MNKTFHTAAFLKDAFGTDRRVHDALIDCGLDAPAPDTISKWRLRDSIPSSFLVPLLLHLSEEKRNKLLKKHCKKVSACLNEQSACSKKPAPSGTPPSIFE